MKFQNKNSEEKTRNLFSEIQNKLISPENKNQSSPDADVYSKTLYKHKIKIILQKQQEPILVITENEERPEVRNRMEEKFYHPLNENHKVLLSYEGSPNGLNILSARIIPQDNIESPERIIYRSTANLTETDHIRFDRWLATSNFWLI